MIRRTHSVLIASAVLLMAGLSVNAQVPLISSTPCGVLSPEGEYSLTMPSDVVRLPGERWAILDGVNDRVVVTDDQGNAITALGAGELNSPLGLTRGPLGNLWVADSGNRRVVAMDLDGVVVASIDLPSGTARPADPVDLAFNLDASILLVVDNDNHRVERLDVESLEWGEHWGQAGRDLDEFNHPFSIAVGSNGIVVVTDVINSRAQSHDPSFDFTFQIGEWGVDGGQLYRPKGVAIDDKGRIFVSDGVLGVVQVFLENGDFLGALSDDGEVRHFTTPSRLAFDERGRLAVVEMRANRVSLWEIDL